MFDLLAAFRRVLETAAREDPSHVVALDTARLDDRIERVLSLLMEREEVAFEELFADDRRRIAIVVTFMAVLELIKMQEIVFRQEENFARIFVVRRAPESREPDVTPDEDATGGQDRQDQDHE